MSDVRTYMRPCVRAYVRTYVRTHVLAYARTYVLGTSTYVRACVHAYVRPRACVRTDAGRTDVGQTDGQYSHDLPARWRPHKIIPRVPWQYEGRRMTMLDRAILQESKEYADFLARLVEDDEEELVEICKA